MGCLGVFDDDCCVVIDYGGLIVLVSLHCRWCFAGLDIYCLLYWLVFDSCDCLC